MPRQMAPMTGGVVGTALLGALGWSLAAAAHVPQAMPRDSRRAAVMQNHYADVLLIHQAVIRGDLQAMRAPARSLAAATAPVGLPDVATPYVTRMKAAAQRAASASDIPAAAAVTATMLATCGLCHDAMGTRPAAADVAPPRVGGTVGHMLEHQRGLDQMLQGLVLPSTTAWQQGVTALERAPLARSDLPPDRKLTSSIKDAEVDVHRLATEARTAASTGSRATLYGRLLGTCAECHSTHRRIWGPGAP
jgi:cytochrome c553